MSGQTRIICRPDGSIDTGLYMARGRAMRGQACHDLLATRQGWIRRFVFWIAAGLARSIKPWTVPDPRPQN